MTGCRSLADTIPVTDRQNHPLPMTLFRAQKSYAKQGPISTSFHNVELWIDPLRFKPATESEDETIKWILSNIMATIKRLI